MSSSIFEKTWKTIQEAMEGVNSILRSGASSAQHQQGQKKATWYSAVYGCAVESGPNALRLRIALHQYLVRDLERNVKPLVTKALKENRETVFHIVSQAFQHFKVLCRFAKDILAYLDVRARQCSTENYIDSSLNPRAGEPTIPKKKDEEYINDRVTIEAICMKAFHSAVYEEVKKDLCSVIVERANQRRDGDSINMDEMKCAIAVFQEVGMAAMSSEGEMAEQVKCSEARARVEKDFDGPYLAATEAYYAKAARDVLQRDAPSFVGWAHSHFELENELLPQAKEKTLAMLTRVVLTECGPSVIQHPEFGFHALLEDSQLSDNDAKMRAAIDMFRLLHAVPSNLKMMSEVIKSRIVAEGMKLHDQAGMQLQEAAAAAPEEQQPSLQLITRFVELHKKMHQFLFGGLFEAIRKNSPEDRSAAVKKDLTETNKVAFEEILNYKRQPSQKAGVPGPQNIKEDGRAKVITISEILSSYVDAVMKRELKDIVDPQAELERIDQLATLFTYLKEKDVFQEYHKAKLAKRLLQTTPNEELEKAFIEKLQREMGKGFTHKMEGMLRDREGTLEISKQFHESGTSQGLPIDLTCQVLAAGHWPAYRSDALVPTAALRQSSDTFARFYKRTHATRTLSWIHMLGSATLSIAFPKGVKDVTCSIHQATILVLIDEAGKMTAQSLSAATKLDVQKGLKPHIQSTYISKAFPLLVRVSESGEPMACDRNVSDADCFAINSAFTYKNRKFKLPGLTSGSGGGGSGMPTDADIDQLRKVQIDACIVRVMKARRVLTFNELTQLVIDQLSKLFQAQPRHIKLRIEDLIMRAYLKRDENDPSTFHYLA